MKTKAQRQLGDAIAPKCAVCKNRLPLGHETLICDKCSEPCVEDRVEKLEEQMDRLIDVIDGLIHKTKGEYP